MKTSPQWLDLVSIEVMYLLKHGSHKEIERQTLWRLVIMKWWLQEKILIDLSFEPNMHLP